MDYVVTLHPELMVRAKRTSALKAIDKCVRSLTGAKIHRRELATVRVCLDESKFSMSDLEHAVNDYGVVDLPASYETL